LSPLERNRRDASQQQPDEPRVAWDVDRLSVSRVEAGPVARPAFRDANDFVTAAFVAHADELFTFLARAGRDDNGAEDIVQETFLRLSREVRAGRTPHQLRAWLYRVASNLLTSRFRRRTVARRWLERYGPATHAAETAPSPEAGLLGRERVQAMERALSVVAVDARQALLLAAEGFSGREIADALGRSEVATRALMCRARIRIRAELEAVTP